MVKLTKPQRMQILEWVVADYSSDHIQALMKENGFPEITRQAIQKYRSRYAQDIERIKQERYSDALTSGLALKDERIKQLREHASYLLGKMGEEREGRFYEKAWRETLNQIAEETGDKSGQLIPNEIVVRFVPSKEMTSAENS